MKKIVSAIFAGALSMAMGVTSIIPATAAPFVPAPLEIKSSVDQVQYRSDRRWRGGHHWRGHRGYRHSRPGYRRHNDGWWYPLAAFGAGAIIGGAIANQPRRVAPVRGSAHVQWCYNKYRSYRSWDNSYQPYGGPRAQCYSPYN
ncbi:BA14K family protein [Phyllobacterium sp. YR531]|uniref:BA14K family protein n=1 Tax=Phyllobacterium sp. YR531 TaxID=1144343 RepID=UPI00026F495B|nr:BA14K family protein [Phyllobacterium sp. YR531]EJN04945.1 BA14K-like protein [Phyllobacterium sp. YR531]